MSYPRDIDTGRHRRTGAAFADDPFTGPLAGVPGDDALRTMPVATAAARRAAMPAYAVQSPVAARPNPVRRPPPARPSRLSRLRTTGAATVIVSTVGIALVNTTGIAHSEPGGAGTDRDTGPHTLSATSGGQAAGTALPAVDAKQRQARVVHDEQFAKLARLLEMRQAAEQQQKTEQLRALLRWVRPDIGQISQHYGNNGHPGVDLAGPNGSAVLAAHYGTVIFAGQESGYGNFVQIQHDDGVVTCYGHLSRIMVSVGERVSTGQEIGLEGSTGFSTGPHLHFEMRSSENGPTINPEAWLAEHGVQL